MKQNLGEPTYCTTARAYILVYPIHDIAIAKVMFLSGQRTWWRSKNKPGAMPLETLDLLIEDEETLSEYQFFGECEDAATIHA